MWEPPFSPVKSYIEEMGSPLRDRKTTNVISPANIASTKCSKYSIPNRELISSAKRDPPNGHPKKADSAPTKLHRAPQHDEIEFTTCKHLLSFTSSSFDYTYLPCPSDCVSSRHECLSVQRFFVRRILQVRHTLLQVVPLVPNYHQPRWKTDWRKTLESRDSWECKPDCEYKLWALAVVLHAEGADEK